MKGIIKIAGQCSYFLRPGSFGGKGGGGGEWVTWDVGLGQLATAVEKKGHRNPVFSVKVAVV